MRRTRQSKNKEKGVSSDTNASFDLPSTSSLQPPEQRQPRRRTSPFRGFDDNIDKTELVVMNRLLKVETDGSCEEAVKDIPITRQNQNKKDVSTMDALLNVPSTSSKPSQQRLPRRVMNIEGGRFCRDSMKVVPKQKRKRSSSPHNKKTEPLTKIDCCIRPKKVFLWEKKLKRRIKNTCENDFIDYKSNGGNFVKIISNLQRGLFKPSVFNEISEQVHLRSLKWFRTFAKYETTDLRVTAMTWHPTNPLLFVSGGKAGSLVLHKVDVENTFNRLNQLKEIPGIGPGGTMECIKFNTKGRDLNVFTASVDGTVACYNFETCDRKCLVASRDPYRTWFCAVDCHRDGKSVYGGDSDGNLAIHHLDSGKTEYTLKTHKLHMSKIRHLEFNTRDPNVMVTCSLDKTVKLWDIRKLNGKNSFIGILKHDNSVASAKFSRTDGSHLLTTDLYSQLRVYKAPSWNLEHQISHPHRHFQHLTIIRASWHPRADLFVVGRYPDPKLVTTLDDLRSVDIYSASSARLNIELTDTSRLITSLAEFNSTGSFLASSTGRTLFMWNERNLNNLTC